MTTLIVVVFLGALGAALRALAGKRLPPLAGTLFVNLAAAFLLGWAADWDGLLADGFRVGLLGALSTWSTLAHEVAQLVRDGRTPTAATYVAVSLSAGVGLAWCGLQLG